MRTIEAEFYEIVFYSPTDNSRHIIMVSNSYDKAFTLADILDHAKSWLEFQEMEDYIIVGIKELEYGGFSIHHPPNKANEADP